MALPLAMILIGFVSVALSCDMVPRSALASEEWSLGSTSAGLREGSSAEQPVDSFTVAVLPDTQYYASSYPEILEAQTRWIVQDRDEGRIALVLHEGDIVDRDIPVQWERAARSLHVLDGIVPYVLSVGNHDYESRGGFMSRSSLIDEYFPASSLTLGSRIAETFQPGHVENSFEIVDTAGGPWLILSLEFGPRDAVLEWADGIAKRFASVPAILVTHAYLYSDNTRYDHLLRPDQLWNPHRYLENATPGSVNDGEEIWRKLVSRNNNFHFVLCGHDLGDGIGRLTSVRSDGTTVVQLLANYQMGARGGEGYLRLMSFSPADRRVTVRTYSPYLNRYKTDPETAFVVEY